MMIINIDYDDDHGFDDGDNDVTSSDIQDDAHHDYHDHTS